MLVLFYGVSCVGKSTIIRNLRTEYNWKIITTYMTRDEREDEFEKKQISKIEMEALEKEGFFLCVNHLSSGSYGTPLNEIEDAIKNKNEIWCLDFPISKKNLFTRFSYIGIVVLPKNLNQLKEQIYLSGRIEREKDILQDYHTNYEKLESNFIAIVNEPEKIRETCEVINRIAISKLSD